MSDTCFVIQPFDGGPYDKRFEETLAPAIRNCGLEPYRVDKDPSVSIPIDEIEEGIRNARVCLADITLDNPNVWFELGYAISCQKELCLICGPDRKAHFPFDVQHRNIIRYSTNSAGDFQKLEEEICGRISALLKKERRLNNVAQKSPVANVEGLANQEIVTLCAIMENRTGINSPAPFGAVAFDLERMGYNRLALNLAFEMLVAKDMVKSETAYDGSNEYEGLVILPSGIEWLMANQDKLDLSPQSKPASRNPFDQELDDDIPF